MLRPFENRKEIKMTTETGPSASIVGPTDRGAPADATNDTEPLSVLAHRLRNSIHVSRVALNVVRSGYVGIAGSTGTMLERSLLEADDLIDRVLATGVFADQCGTAVKTKADTR